ncbi:MAG: hypothetical protein DRJ64_05825, partial [Thermoprotei archaeon]
GIGNTKASQRVDLDGWDKLGAVATSLATSLSFQFVGAVNGKLMANAGKGTMTRLAQAFMFDTVTDQVLNVAVDYVNGQRPSAESQVLSFIGNTMFFGLHHGGSYLKIKYYGKKVEYDINKIKRLKETGELTQGEYKKLKNSLTKSLGALTDELADAGTIYGKKFTQDSFKRLFNAVRNNEQLSADDKLILTAYLKGRMRQAYAYKFGRKPKIKKDGEVIDNEVNAGEVKQEGTETETETKPYDFGETINIDEVYNDKIGKTQGEISELEERERQAYNQGETESGKDRFKAPLSNKEKSKRDQAERRQFQSWEEALKDIEPFIEEPYNVKPVTDEKGNTIFKIETDGLTMVESLDMAIKSSLSKKVISPNHSSFMKDIINLGENDPNTLLTMFKDEDKRLEWESKFAEIDNKVNEMMSQDVTFRYFENGQLTNKNKHLKDLEYHFMGSKNKLMRDNPQEYATILKSIAYGIEEKGIENIVDLYGGSGVYSSMMYLMLPHSTREKVKNIFLNEYEGELSDAKKKSFEWLFNDKGEVRTEEDLANYITDMVNKIMSPENGYGKILDNMYKYFKEKYPTKGGGITAGRLDDARNMLKVILKHYAKYREGADTQDIDLKRVVIDAFKEILPDNVKEKYGKEIETLYGENYSFADAVKKLEEIFKKDYKSTNDTPAGRKVKNKKFVVDERGEYKKKEGTASITSDTTNLAEGLSVSLTKEDLEKAYKMLQLKANKKEDGGFEVEIGDKNLEALLVVSEPSFLTARTLKNLPSEVYKTHIIETLGNRLLTYKKVLDVKGLKAKEDAESFIKFISTDALNMKDHETDPTKLVFGDDMNLTEISKKSLFLNDPPYVATLGYNTTYWRDILKGEYSEFKGDRRNYIHTKKEYTDTFMFIENMLNINSLMDKVAEHGMILGHDSYFSNIPKERMKDFKNAVWRFINHKLKNKIEGVPEETKAKLQRYIDEFMYLNKDTRNGDAKGQMQSQALDNFVRHMTEGIYNLLREGSAYSTNLKRNSKQENEIMYLITQQSKREGETLDKHSIENAQRDLEKEIYEKASKEKKVFTEEEREALKLKRAELDKQVDAYKKGNNENTIRILKQKLTNDTKHDLKLAKLVNRVFNASSSLFQSKYLNSRRSKLSPEGFVAYILNNLDAVGHKILNVKNRKAGIEFLRDMLEILQNVSGELPFSDRSEKIMKISSMIDAMMSLENGEDMHISDAGRGNIITKGMKENERGGSRDAIATLVNNYETHEGIIGGAFHKLVRLTTKAYGYIPKLLQRDFINIIVKDAKLKMKSLDLAYGVKTL